MHTTFANSSLSAYQRIASSCRQPLAFVILFAISLWPIYVTNVPMLSDYPNHLARMHILQANGSSPELNEFYSVDWRLLPNLAMDLIVPPLARLVGIYEAGRIFLALTLLLLSSGTVALHYALHRRVSVWPLLVMILLYNQMFLYGLLNFLFGMGITLWGLAAWVAVAAKPRLWHAPAFAFVAVLVWISHMSAFGVFALALAVFTARKGVPTKLRLTSFAILAATLVLPVALTLGASNTTGLTTPVPLDMGLALYTLLKPIMLFVTLSAFNAPVDLLLTLFVFVILIRGFFTGTLVLHPAMRWPLLAMVIVFMLMPPKVMGSELADFRVLIALEFLFIASVDIRPVQGKTIIAVGGILIAGFLIRTALIAEQWKKSDEVALAAQAAFSDMAPGSRLYAALSIDSFETNYEGFLPCLAVVSRSAFVPSMYAQPGAQPIVMTPLYQKLRSESPQPRVPVGKDPDWVHVTKAYDYVWIPTEENFNAVPMGKLKLMATHPRFKLYQVIR